ncbi:zf-HC2 domain-containing protein [Sporosarcina cascadiensis]|uniref:zf-HC2 domain-containing protein n=1 Tax=Sporosarcina cascadiensis TaxID=2660747 RepID=UPI00129BD8D8|nr:zf-HC2 domain-containing protein [Sporosarcina cascadiensis]
MSNKMSCEIIKDILPLYYDGVCSDDSKKMVEEHMLNCDHCKCELDRMQDEIKVPKSEIQKYRNEGEVIRNITNAWKRTKVKSFIRGIIITIILFSLITLGYNRLFHWNITKVPTSVVEVTQVSELTDGKIVFHVELTDGYALNETIYNIDKDGKFYVTPVRPIVKKKAQSPYGLANDFDFIDIEEAEENNGGKKINALYYGTPEDNILIWKKGMNLPKASEEIENMFHFE